MQIRRLTPADASAFQSLRLESLLTDPAAFGASFEEERAIPLSTIESRLLEKNDRASFGAFNDGMLLGHVGLGREGLKKLSHKGFIWGMYVAPAARRHGVARELLGAALSLARSVGEIRQVNLCVNAGNLAAIALYESAGFKTWGREPGAMLVDGELFDEVHMSLRFSAE